MCRRITLLLISASFLLTTAFAQAPGNIATVNGEPITANMFQQRVRLARWMSAQQLLQIMQSYGPNALNDPTSPFGEQYKQIKDDAGFAKQVLDNLITIKLVQKEAAARGLAITDADTQEQINTFFGYSANEPPAVPTGQPTPNPTQMAETFQEDRDNYFGQAGAIARMNQAEVIATFAEQALQVKLYQTLTKNVPLETEQVKVRHIVVDTEDRANALLAEIKAGKPFTDVAKAGSQDAVSAQQGGDLGWTPRGVYVPEFEAAIWSVQPGTLVGPVKTVYGFHLILVEAREVRLLSDADLARERSIVYEAWLKQTRDKAAIQIVDNWQTFIPAEPTLKELGLP
ncbi:MAG: peptidylprolyl isomerase [Anaerolineae bacterium]|nr:peptidylprolyl isomerase [Anaerolineae bacterium]